ncbi:MAG TPA: hypothetical protein VMW27_21295 [Thermoanaerobaculia bacterium]|nr:hypothetical protein [Thermoanaerobaculia bacterium]
MPQSLRRSVSAPVVLAVLFVLVLPAATEAAPQQTPTITGSLWSLFTAIWTKAGCLIDPDGTPEAAKAGCLIDPSGLNGSDSSTSLAQDKEGCLIDPDGATGPAFTTPPEDVEEGCLIDPNGSCITSPSPQV